MTRLLRGLALSVLALPLPNCGLSHAVTNCREVQATATLVLGTERVRLTTSDVDFMDGTPSVVCAATDSSAAQVAADLWWRQYIVPRLSTICRTDPASPLGRRACNRDGTARAWCAADVQVALGSRTTWGVGRGPDPSPGTAVVSPCPAETPTAILGLTEAPTFRDRPLGDAFDDQPVTLSSAGINPVQVLSYEVDLGTDDFRILPASDCVAEDAVSNLVLPTATRPTCTLSLRFLPSQGDLRTGSLRIDTATYPYVTRLPLAGNGLRGELLSETRDFTTPEMLPGICMGDGMRVDGRFARTIRLRNAGPGTVRVSSVSLSPFERVPNPFRLNPAPAVPRSMVTGDVVEVTVEASPTSDTATLEVWSDAVARPVRVSLVGSDRSCR